MLKKLTKILHNHSVLLFLVFVTGLALRLALLQVRWINPDEGAHLMDARLFLDGLMPIVDFGSRQPLYVFIYSVFFKLFGVSLSVGRMVPLISSLAVALLLYLIGQRIFNKNVGLLSATIYLFLPLILIWSVIVKTEQIALVFVTLSVYLVVVYLSTKIQRPTWLTLAGICAAAAFYIRQPTLYLPLATIGYFLIFAKIKFRERFVLIFQYLLGYLAVVAGFFAFYLKRLNIVDILFSQLNPLNLIWNRLMHTLGLLPQKYRIADGESFRILNQDIQYTATAWEHAVFMSLFILVAALLYILLKKYKTKEQPVLFLSLWFGFVVLLYLFQSLNRGFYSQYFTEALPPAIILGAAAIQSFSRHLKLNTIYAIGLFVLFYFIYAVQKVFWGLYVGVSPLFVLFTFLLAIAGTFFGQKNKAVKFKILEVGAVTLVSVVVLFLFELLGVNDIFAVLAAFVSVYFVLEYFYKNKTSFVHYAILFILLIAFFISAAVSGRYLGPAYEAVWPQQALKEVKNIIVPNSNGSDTVLCGGMIWTLESDLTPFLNVAHPTEFLKKYQADFEEQFKQHPPRFIIIDLYTKKKFQKYWPFLQNEIERNYQLIHNVKTPTIEIKIYENVKHQLDLAPAFAITEGAVRK